MIAFEADAEAGGLRARAVKAPKAAGFLSDIDGSKSNDARRAKLKEFEQIALATEARLSQLRDHLAHIQRIEAVTKSP